MPSSSPSTLERNRLGISMLDKEEILALLNSFVSSLFLYGTDSSTSSLCFRCSTKERRREESLDLVCGGKWRRAKRFYRRRNDWRSERWAGDGVEAVAWGDERNRKHLVLGDASGGKSESESTRETKPTKASSGGVRSNYRHSSQILWIPPMGDRHNGVCRQGWAPGRWAAIPCE
ncbi:hypothetical protein B296_00033076 [Ensete ventricosum]|uniref:Uncharacterized protein n=1 Tax=Ensete ventricosum TaxID=4639 RepID=A0A426Z0B2_ENSVE|nr:hypothetical protein B296_00033076 [Ensete ventricosum]